MGTTLTTAVRQLSFATSVAAALSITACSPRPSAESRVCADTTGRRISDDNCRRSGGGAGYYGGRWYYGGRETAGARIGDKVSGGSYSPRGGFGASARGSSGG